MGEKDESYSPCPVGWTAKKTNTTEIKPLGQNHIINHSRTSTNFQLIIQGSLLINYAPEMRPQFLVCT